MLIQGKVDILVITDTKTDSNFSLNQFEIPSYSKCYKFDRNRNGEGVVIYVSEDISNRQIKSTILQKIWKVFLSKLF